MAKGLSVHIGVNECDPEHYNGWIGRLEGCEADANDHQKLAESAGFETSTYKTADATRSNVINAIKGAAQDLVPGDMFLLTYAGHGGQVTDVDGDEEDTTDETWILYDGELLDDELNVMWADFKEGVRVLILSDSCHSGTVSKSVDFRRDMMNQRNSLFGNQPLDSKEAARFMPRDAAVGTQRKNKEFYAKIQTDLPSPRPEIKASVRLISGCQDNQCSYEVDGHGTFTQTLLGVWQDGSFDGTYDKLHKTIIGRMKAKQQPNHLVLGKPNEEYNRQKPFTIA